MPVTQDDLGLRLAANIRSRRTQLKISQDELAERAGLGLAQIVSAIEHGNREVKAVELTAIARALHCDWTDLLEETVEQPTQVAWRRRPETGAEEDQARFLRLCEFYRLVEDWTGEREDVGLAPARPPRGEPDYSWARLIAEDARRTLNLGRFPATSLLKTLEESYGVKIFFLPDLRGSAASSLGNFGAAVVLNATEARWRRNFSLAHELFHLITWQYLPPKSEGHEGVYLWSDKTESLADVFASTLLLPEDTLRESLAVHQHDGAITHRGLVEIAEEFDVSTEALLWRLVALRRLSSARAEELRHLRQLARQDRDSLDGDEAAPQWPKRFLRLLKTAYLREQVSAGRVAQMLGKRLGEIRQRLVEWEEDQAGAEQTVRLAGH